MLIAGVGGQGLVTLTKILAKAAFLQGYDVKTSELHGLSQRGGSVETHIRFGEKVYSPLIGLGEADFILSLEISEALKMIPFSNKETVFLVNENYIPFENSLSLEETKKRIKKLTKYLIPASDICKKELGNEVVSGIYLLGFAVFKKMIPLKPNSILKAIDPSPFTKGERVEQVVPEKYSELNKKAFNLAND